MDEKDRSTQKRGEGGTSRLAGAVAGHGSTNSVSDGSSQLSLEISISRPAEIEAALQQFVSPKVTSFQLNLLTLRNKLPGLSKLQYWETIGQWLSNLQTVGSACSIVYKENSRTIFIRAQEGLYAVLQSRPASREASYGNYYRGTFRPNFPDFPFVFPMMFPQNFCQRDASVLDI